MESRAFSAQVKDLDNQIRRILRPIDVPKQNKTVRDALADLIQVLVDSRIYTNDYELSETREEQLESARQAKMYLDKARKDILSASEYDIFSAFDVAELTAQIEHIITNLR